LSGCVVHTVTLKTFFGKYGEVVEAIVMKDPATKRSRGFGFVVFTHNSAVDRVLHEHELRVDGRKVRFRPISV
jgi:RNA-binding protein Musashi